MHEDDVDFTSQAIRALRSTDKRGSMDQGEPQLLITSFEIKKQKSGDKTKHHHNREDGGSSSRFGVNAL